MEQKITELANKYSEMTNKNISNFYKKVKNKIKISKSGSNITKLIAYQNLELQNIYLKNEKKMCETDKKFIEFLLKLKEKINFNSNISNFNPNISNSKLQNENTELQNESTKLNHKINLSEKIAKKEKNEIIKTESSVDNENELIKMLEMNIKRGALGFQTNLYDENGIFLLNSVLEPHIYEIIIQVHNHAEIYKKLKNTQSFRSKAQLEFYEVVRKYLKEYEESVIHADTTLLDFHVQMRIPYRNLESINQLFDSFFDNPKNPFEFLKIYKNPLYFLELKLFDKAIVSAALQINKLLNDWIFYGEFTDSANEFFIVKNDDSDLWNSFGIDYGLVPHFLNNELVEKILYLGKCRVLLKEIHKNNPKKENKKNLVKLNILDLNISECLEILIQKMNKKIKNEILIKYKVFEYLKFTKDIFLGNRTDFMETLIISISDLHKGSFFNKRSISYVLDAVLVSTFGENEFIKQIDMCILDDYNDYISLFCHLEFPMNLFITKESMMKLVSIFKFLWRIKRIEFLLTKNIKNKNIRKYRNIILKLNFYFCEEVIQNLWKFEYLNIDQFRKEIGQNLDKILNKMFQIQNKGKENMDTFLNILEKYTNSENVSIEYLNQKFKDLIVNNENVISNSFLFDLQSLI